MTVTGDLNSLYKVAYASGIEDLIPPTGKISKRVPFVSAEMMNGKYYEQPVILTAESGFTYSLDTQSAYTLNDAIGMQMQSAQVPGADIVLDSAVGYNQAARASHSKTSFKSVMSTKFENMLKSSEKRVEIGAIHGQVYIGTTSTQAVATTNPLAIVLDRSHWSTGIWAGSENSQVVFVKSSDNTAVDSLNSFTVSKVDIENRTLYISAGTQGTPGSLVALEAAVEAYGCNIHFYGSVSGSAGTFAFAEMAGLKKIITNTGTLFNISAADYDLWKGNTVATTGQLTLSKIFAAASRAVQRGLDGDAYVMVNPTSWADLSSNAAALRRFDGSYSRKKSVNGSRELEFEFENGVLKVFSYNLCMEGDCIIWPEDKAIRVGARPLGLNDPTRPQDEIFFTIPGKAGVGLRAYTNQAIFLEAPAQAVLINGIVPSV